MKELKQSETQDIPFSEKDKWKELADNFTVSETAYPRTVEQADHIVDKRLKERNAASELQKLNEQRPMERLYTRDWEKINVQHEVQRDLDASNPNFEMGREWKINCQRCVPTFEMRRRGYDVTAKPKPVDDLDLSYRPFDVWEKPDVISCKGDGLQDVQNSMAKWGDGARAQVVVVWKNTNSGHTFSAEQVDGKTRFYDPQSGSSDVIRYFKNVEPDSVKICRIDKLDVTDKILDCCRKV